MNLSWIQDKNNKEHYVWRYWAKGGRVSGVRLHFLDDNENDNDNKNINYHELVMNVRQTRIKQTIFQ